MGDSFQKKWEQVRVAFDSMTDVVSAGRPPPGIGEKMKAYTEVLEMIRSEGNAAEVYESAKNMLIDHLTARVTSLSFEVSGEELLHAVYKAWHSHQVIVKWAEGAFGYLNRYYVASECKDPIKPMTLRCFLTAVFEKVKDRLCDILMEEVRKERTGDTINRNVMRESVQMYIEMGLSDQLALYRKEFEGPFIERTKNFYGGLAAKWLSEEGGMHTFLEQADKHIQEEESRAKAYLDISSREPVLECMRRVLLHQHSEMVMTDPGAGLKSLLTNWKVEGIARMFRLFSQVPGGSGKMSEITREFIKEEGAQLNGKLATGAHDQKQHVEEVLLLWDKYVDLIRNNCKEQSGAPHPVMAKAQREAFEVFFNESVIIKKEGAKDSPKATASELLSGYCDSIMKNDKLTPDEFEATLTKIIDLFSVIAEKDLFQEYHRKALSKRLLLATKMSVTQIENERQLIGKLKVKMGPPYTSKFEHMLQDKATSEDTTKNFTAWLNDKVSAGKDKDWTYEFSASVLTSAHWPPFKTEPLTLPNSLASALTNFGVFYSEKNSSRKLTWPHSLGTATVTKMFAKGMKEMSVITLQMCVMLELNETGAVGLPHLVEGSLKMDKDDAKRTLVSLSFGKFAVLKKKEEDKKKTVTDKDEFIVNDKFSHPQRKFKIPMASKVGGDPVEKTDESRRHVVDATVVRIMKSRKTLPHSELVAEAIKQLSILFRPDPKLIKKRIEDLITRGYLERHEDDRNMYNYLA